MLQRFLPILPTTYRCLAWTVLLLAVVAIHAPAEAHPAYHLQGPDLVMVSAAVEPIPMAVVDFKAIGAPQDFADAVAENLRNALVQHQQFTVIERAQIQQAIREQSFSQTGLVDDQEAVTLGKLVGARVIVVGSVTKLGDTCTINARFIDVTTGRVTDAKSLKTDNANYLADVVDDLASALGGKVVAASPSQPAYRMTAPRMVPTGKSKLLAAAMSAAIPGSGQVYNGNIGWGVTQFLMSAAGVSMGWLGYQYRSPITYSLGGITLAGASLWSCLDGWFTTVEEVPAR
jgi:TolB-like protein